MAPARARGAPGRAVTAETRTGGTTADRCAPGSRAVFTQDGASESSRPRRGDSPT